MRYYSKSQDSKKQTNNQLRWCKKPRAVKNISDPKQINLKRITLQLQKKKNRTSHSFYKKRKLQNNLRPDVPDGA
jgi:hypothetical protein